MTTKPTPGAGPVHRGRQLVPEVERAGLFWEAHIRVPLGRDGDTTLTFSATGKTRDEALARVVALAKRKLDLLC